MKKIHIWALLALVAIGVAIYFFEKKQQDEPESQQAVVTSCTDSDGGINIYTPGNAKTSDQRYGVIHVTEDSCVVIDKPFTDNFSAVKRIVDACPTGSEPASTCYLMESYCSPERDSFDLIHCDEGCASGACVVRESPPLPSPH